MSSERKKAKQQRREKEKRKARNVAASHKRGHAAQQRQDLLGLLYHEPAALANVLNKDPETGKTIAVSDEQYQLQSMLDVSGVFGPSATYGALVRRLSLDVDEEDVDIHDRVPSLFWRLTRAGADTPALPAAVRWRRWDNYEEFREMLAQALSQISLARLLNDDAGSSGDVPQIIRPAVAVAFMTWTRAPEREQPPVVFAMDERKSLMAWIFDDGFWLPVGPRGTELLFGLSMASAGVDPVTRAMRDRLKSQPDVLAEIEAEAYVQECSLGLLWCSAASLQAEASAGLDALAQACDAAEEQLGKLQASVRRQNAEVDRLVKELERERALVQQLRAKALPVCGASAVPEQPALQARLAKLFEPA